MHRDSFFQFPFRWIYFCHSNKSTGKQTGKGHLCTVGCCWRVSEWYPATASLMNTTICNGDCLGFLFIVDSTLWNSILCTVVGRQGSSNESFELHFVDSCRWSDSSWQREKSGALPRPSWVELNWAELKELSKGTTTKKVLWLRGFDINDNGTSCFS